MIWGDKAWTFLFSVVGDYPDNPGIDVQHYYEMFFRNLQRVLPCEVCRGNYSQHFRKWPIDRYLKSRAALFRWLANIYNETRHDISKEPLTDAQIIYQLFGECAGSVPQEMMQIFSIPPRSNEQMGGGTSQRLILIVLIVLVAVFLLVQQSQA